MMTKFFDSIIMLSYGETKVAKRKIYGAKKKRYMFEMLMLIMWLCKIN